MHITPEAAVGLVIDLQERLLPHIQQNKELVDRCMIFVKGLKLLNVPVLSTEQYPRGLGKTDSCIREILTPDMPLEKITFSCCGTEDLMSRLESKERNIVLIAGIETHVCVLQTAIDLHDQGFVPVVVEDAVGSRRETDNQTALRRIVAEGILTTTVESVLFELMKTARHPQFKNISQLVK